MVKSQYFSRVRNTSENVEFCTARDEIYLVLIFGIFFLFYTKMENYKKKTLTFFVVVSRPI